MWVLPLGFAFGALLAQPWQEPCSQFASTDAAASTTKAAPSEPERLGHPQRGDSTQQKKPPDSEARQPTLAKELGNGYFQAFSSSQANSASLSASRGTMRTERSESNVSAASTHPSTTPIFSSTERASDAVPKIPLDGRPGQRMAPNKSPHCVSFCPAAGTETKLRSDDFRFDTSSAPPTRSLPTVPQRPVGRSPPAPPQDRPMAPSRSPPAPPQDRPMAPSRSPPAPPQDRPTAPSRSPPAPPQDRPTAPSRSPPAPPQDRPTAPHDLSPNLVRLADKVPTTEILRAAAAKKNAEDEAREAAAKKKAGDEARAAAAKKKAEDEARAAAAKKKAENEARTAAAKKKAENEARAAAAKKKAENEARAAPRASNDPEKVAQMAEKSQGAYTAPDTACKEVGQLNDEDETMLNLIASMSDEHLDAYLDSLPPETCEIIVAALDSAQKRQDVSKVAPTTPKSSEGDLHGEAISSTKVDLGRDPSPKVASRPSSSRQSSPGSPTTPRSPGGLWASLKTSLAGSRSTKLSGPNRSPQKSPKSSPPTLRSLTTKPKEPPPMPRNSMTKTTAQGGARSSSNPQYGASAPSVRPRSVPSLQTEQVPSPASANTRPSQSEPRAQLELMQLQLQLQLNLEKLKLQQQISQKSSSSEQRPQDGGGRQSSPSVPSSVRRTSLRGGVEV